MMLARAIVSRSNCYGIVYMHTESIFAVIETEFKLRCRPPPAAKFRSDRLNGIVSHRESQLEIGARFVPEIQSHRPRPNLLTGKNAVAA